eukprot:CAMPEP_0184523674 /NCGR_PEP_ID=MMETSP0198_2-20121128/9028_1 /TAXON_ID=1112570 /ORGANISM="Thraustochytrium sp., Strain LLF1b" /LENGTH=718 /DNA_ID=CAMNT_0026914757 /DNA_START=136 /DNA_END=2292 /DNA_ORIENTATION=+
MMRPARTRALVATARLPAAIHNTAIRALSSVSGEKANVDFAKYKYKPANPNDSAQKELKASIAEHRVMEKGAADDLANQISSWGISKGAETIAHWASPIRGPNNLLKHDTFVDINFKTMEATLDAPISSSKLFFNETDGSSFPNGGLRDTHQAAGYLTWDKTSAPFVYNKTLFLPSAFISYNGDALDEKTPLLRSQEQVDIAGTRLIRHLGDEEGTGVDCNVGWEQEFFLIEREAYLARPDLLSCGRTLFGAAPPRGQQTDQNYFSRVPPRVKQVLEETSVKLLELGMTLSVYHSEVAPSQFEFCPVFSLVNSAADGNVLAMDVLQDVANEHGMIALYHEKPFANLNGSGKHSNWGLNVRGTNRNLFVPGKNAKDQRSFIAMVACMLRSVHLYGDLIRAAVGSAGNDHRLGAQEAPPAIMSLCLGDLLGKHCQDIVDNNGPLEGYGLGEKLIQYGSSSLQPVKAGGEDRNRTAPFPFCGNRFEFRAVGSEFHIGFPLTVVQTAMADSMAFMSDELDSGKPLDEVVKAMFEAHLPAMFNGDGYSEEWQQEAKRRGLPNLPNTVAALEVFDDKKNIDLFVRNKVFKEREVKARKNIYLEKYTETLLIEANCLIDMMETGVLPACAEDLAVYGHSKLLKGDRGEVYDALRESVDNLVDAIDAVPHDGSLEEQAQYCLEVVIPASNAVRSKADQTERLVAKDLWPYPSYQDILFNHHTLARQ